MPEKGNDHQSFCEMGEFEMPIKQLLDNCYRKQSLFLVDRLLNMEAVC